MSLNDNEGNCEGMLMMFNSTTPIINCKKFDVRLNFPYQTNVLNVGTTFWNCWSSMLLKFVLVWLYNYFDMSVTDESYIDEMAYY